MSLFFLDMSILPIRGAGVARGRSFWRPVCAQHAAFLPVAYY